MAEIEKIKITQKEFDELYQMEEPKEQISTNVSEPEESIMIEDSYEIVIGKEDKKLEEQENGS